MFSIGASEGASSMIGSGDRKRIRFQFLPVPTVTECIEQSAYLSSEDGGGGGLRKAANTGATIRFTYRFELVWKRVALVKALGKRVNTPESCHLPTMRCAVKCEENEFWPQVAALFFWKQIVQSRAAAETICRLSLSRYGLSLFFSSCIRTVKMTDLNNKRGKKEKIEVSQVSKGKGEPIVGTITASHHLQLDPRPKKKKKN